MGWVKRLADHVIQDRLGEPDLEFVWAEGRPADPAVEAKVIDTYVRNGVYAINEARDLLGLDPVPGGDRPMVYGTQGAVPLAQGGGKLAATHLRKGQSRLRPVTPIVVPMQSVDGSGLECAGPGTALQCDKVDRVVQLAVAALIRWGLHASAGLLDAKAARHR